MEDNYLVQNRLRNLLLFYCTLGSEPHFMAKMGSEHKGANLKGFSLIEMLVVIGIVLILGSGGLVVSGVFLNRRGGQTAVKVLEMAIREAELNSMSLKQGKRWGVKTGNGEVIVFGGGSFTNRDSDWDEVWHLSRGVTVNNQEVVFSKFEGRPVNGEVNFQLNWSGGSKTIKVNVAGGIEE